MNSEETDGVPEIGVRPPLSLVEFGRADDELPVIEISTAIGDVVDMAEVALAHHGSVRVFQRGRLLVVVARDGRRLRPGVSYPAGAPFVSPIAPARLRELLAERARWVRVQRRTGEAVPALPPEWAVNALLSRETSALPVLRGVIEVPALRWDGTLIEQAGYDEESGLYYDPGTLVVPPIPASPTKEEAVAAAGAILDPFGDFPLVAASDRAAVLAAILTLLHRHGIDGPTPLFAVRAPTPASGKGLLVKAICVLYTGRPPGTMAPATEAEETRKLILTIAVEAPCLVLFDNVVGSFGNPTLAAALTSDEWTGRWLGVSRTVTAPLRPTWFLTGNNVTFRADCGRRVVPCDLRPAEEHPEDRVRFRHPNLLDHIRTQRGALIAAGLTLLRAYFVAGCPQHGRPPMGSFESWDAVVRGAVVWATGADPCAGRERIREDDDDDLAALRSLLQACRARRGGNPWTVADLVSDATSDAVLREALTALAPADREGRLDAKRLGMAIRSFRHRPAGGLRLETGGKPTSGRARWVVVTCASSGGPDGGPGGLGGPTSSLRAEKSELYEGLGDALRPDASPARPEGVHQVHQVHHEAGIREGGSGGDGVCPACLRPASDAHECPEDVR